MAMDQYKVDVPEGVSGDWAVERFTVSDEDAALERIRSMFSASSRGRGVPVGEYTKLSHRGRVVMSDTPDEIRDHHEPMRRASGHCLVNGLGLGVVANGMLLNANVTRVTAIEISQDVINLVAPHLTSKFGDRFQFVLSSAFDYQPPSGTRFGYVWHDIWPSICATNLEDMKRLHRKYGRRCDRQGSWARELCTKNSRRSYSG